MRKITEPRMIPGVKSLREKAVQGDAAFAQTPHQRDLVAAAQGVDLLPPKLVHAHDVRVIVTAEYDIVLHQAASPALLSVKHKEQEYSRKTQIADIAHVAAHHRLVIDIAAARMRDSAVLHAGGHLLPYGTVYRAVAYLYVPVYPEAGFISGEQDMRVHLGIAGQQAPGAGNAGGMAGDIRGIAGGTGRIPGSIRTGRTGGKFPYLPYADAVSTLLARPDEADVIHITPDDTGLPQLVIVPYYTGIYGYFSHNAPNL